MTARHRPLETGAFAVVGKGVDGAGQRVRGVYV